MEWLIKILHLRGIHRTINLFIVNKLLAGPNPKTFERKRKLLRAIGFKIGEGTKIVGPIECWGTLEIGSNCWIGKNLCVNGNGQVVIGDSCDLGPEVTFQTGGHLIGTAERRAGEGSNFKQIVGNGVWIGGRSTILNDVTINAGAVVAGCSCVTKDVEKNTIVGGVPAKVLRRLDDETARITEKQNG